MNHGPGCAPRAAAFRGPVHHGPGGPRRPALRAGPARALRSQRRSGPGLRPGAQDPRRPPREAEVRQDRPAAALPAERERPPDPGGGEAHGLGARRRPVHVRGRERASLRGADPVGVRPRRGRRAGRSRDRAGPAAALPGAQPVHGGAGVRAGLHEHEAGDGREAATARARRRGRPLAALSGVQGRRGPASWPSAARTCPTRRWSSACATRSSARRGPAARPARAPVAARGGLR